MAAPLRQEKPLYDVQVSDELVMQYRMAMRGTNRTSSLAFIFGDFPSLTTPPRFFQTVLSIENTQELRLTGGSKKLIFIGRANIKGHDERVQLTIYLAYSRRATLQIL